MGNVDPFVLRVAQRFAATKSLDLDWVEGLRKDFLVLLKNLPRVKDYKTAHQLRDAFRIYRKNFEELMFEHFLNKLKYEHDNYGLSENDAKYINTKLRKEAWDFQTDLSLPIGFADDYHSEAMRFANYEREVGAWKTRVQRKAQVFWKSMKEVIDWHEKFNRRKLDVRVPDQDKTTIEGFKFVMVGYNPEDDANREALEVLKEGLKVYRQRASAVAPILIRKQLPIIAEFKSTLDKGGEYNGDGTISFYMSSVSAKNPAWVVHVMAHEMGHHLWKTVLSAEAQKFWTDTIYGDFGDLDIAKLVREWPGDTWAFEFPDVMGREDPVLALQVQALTHDRAFTSLNTKEDFQKLLDQGQTTIRVPKHPITGYANKNPEEAFCETIGLLVAYGPRAVDETVRWWLETVLPGEVRVGRMVNRVVERFDLSSART